VEYSPVMGKYQIESQSQIFIINFIHQKFDSITKKHKHADKQQQLEYK